MESRFDCILFDLDGTIADTAPDLGGALNLFLAEEGREPLPLETTRPVTSQGIRGLLRVGLGIGPEHPAYREYSERILAHYAKNICNETRLFDGIADLLETLDASAIKWGIVTNKHSRFTAPLVRALGLDRRAICIVSGDTAARPKPHPDPLIHACAAANTAPLRCVYVGDDLRDVQAGQAAGMTTIAAAWGYLGEDSPVETWGADAIVATPEGILDALLLLPLQSPLGLLENQ